MKQLITSISIACFFVIGFSQNQTATQKTGNDSQTGPKMERLQKENDGHVTVLSSTEKQIIKSPDFLFEKNVSVKEMDNPDKKMKTSELENPKFRRNVSESRSTIFQKGNGKIYNHTKSLKRLNRADGFVPREEMKKIDGHATVNEDLLLQALGNRKPIEARTINTK